MKSETLLEILRLALRLLEVYLKRRSPGEQPATRLDKVVERAAPLARKALDQFTPASKSEAAPAGRRRRRGGLGGSVLLGAVAAGAVAYLIVRQQQRVRERYRPLAAQFPYELLDILSAPGGGGRLTLTDAGLADAATGVVYPVVDGIPDFSPASAAREEKPQADEWGTLRELVTPLGPSLLGANPAGNSAFAASAATAAGAGWMLSVPCGMGDVEIEMARANPQARLLCLHTQWNTLLEVRRRARAEKLDNLYCARGTALLLPIGDRSLQAVWSANGFHLYTAPEMAMTQMARALKSGGVLAAVSLVKGGPDYAEQLIERSGQRLPGRRDPEKHLSLLKASGFGALNVYRDGAYLRLMAVRE